MTAQRVYLDGAEGSDRGAFLTALRSQRQRLFFTMPEELVVDLSEREMGDTIRMSDITLPKGAAATITDRDFVIATLKVSSAALSEINDEAASGDAEA